MTEPRETRQEALRRYVRARSPDFNSCEQRDLDAWLAADASHADEYARLQHIWQTLDALATRFAGNRLAADQSRRPPLPTRRWVLGGFVAAGASLALVFAVLPAAAPIRHIETAQAQHRRVTVHDGIEISLNADTSIDLLDGESPRIDLLRGDIYVNVGAGGSERLEIRVGRAEVHDIGTHFAVAAAGQGGSLAVEQGRVELRTETTRLTVFAGHGADFADDGRVREVVLAENAVAPWRFGRWQFNGTPLADLALELQRQQRIRVDIADPAVAALTVSGSFGFAEPERVLWAAAQVHGLTLRRIGERRFQLSRG